MSKWPMKLSTRPQKQELADYAELDCWKQGSTSTNALSADLGRLDENDYYRGVLEDRGEVPQVVEAAYLEIEQRKEACRDGYPFEIGERGYTLRVIQETGNHKHIVYKYLLLATRLNMRDNRVHAEIDGSLLLEELAADVLREYLGDRGDSLVFGTAAGMDDFPGKVNNLCKQIKEGNRFHNHSGAPLNERDGKLDVVAWKHFADQLPGKLIAFGQCKTGTNYKDTFTQLQPESFCKKWLQSPVILNPVRMFFVAEAVSRLHWKSTSIEAGLLFDRCRIVDFCDDISADVLERVTAWTAAAAKAVELPGL